MQNDVITKHPNVLGGTPVFRGYSCAFPESVGLSEAGQTLDEFVDDFPTVSRETAVQALEPAKELNRQPTSMKLLLDECIPRSEHERRTVPELGWAGRKNSELLSLAEQVGFEIFLDS